MLVKYGYAHEDVSYVSVIRNKIVDDEGNSWISSYTETGHQNRN